MAEFRLTSPAFRHDDDLPDRFTAEGGDISPPLEWEGIPEGTRELLLICDDPDAEFGVFTHWIVYGILPDAKGLPEGLPGDVVIDEPVDLMQGLNEYEEAGYSGPAASEERGPHRYFFRLFALDAELDLPPGVRRSELREATTEHLIDSTELVVIA